MRRAIGTGTLSGMRYGVYLSEEGRREDLFGPAPVDVPDIELSAEDLEAEDVAEQRYADGQI